MKEGGRFVGGGGGRRVEGVVFLDYSGATHLLKCSTPSIFLFSFVIQLSNAFVSFHRWWAHGNRRIPLSRQLPWVECLPLEKNVFMLGDIVTAVVATWGWVGVNEPIGGGGGGICQTTGVCVQWGREKSKCQIRKDLPYKHSTMLENIIICVFCSN